MAMAAPHVVPIFATPFGVAAVPDAETLNPALAALLAERATPARADPSHRQPLSYRSCDDLLEWVEEPMRRLGADMVSAVRGVARSINDMSDDQFAALQVQARAWYTIVHPDGCVPSHNHPNATWCAIYCVAAPPASSARYDSGVVRLHGSFRATMFMDATNSAPQLPYRPGHNTWRPVPGQLVVFPASVTYEIALLRAAGELVLVSALARFVAPGQMEMPGW
jgi:hypothetical protein